MTLRRFFASLDPLNRYTVLHWCLAEDYFNRDQCRRPFLGPALGDRSQILERRMEMYACSDYVQNVTPIYREIRRTGFREATFFDFWPPASDDITQEGEKTHYRL